MVIAEIGRLRDSALLPSISGDWPEAMPIGDEGIGLDSLEQLGALGALAEVFDLDDGILGEESPRTVGDWIDWIIRGTAQADAFITVRSSGTTDRPHPYSHRVSELLEEASFLAGLLEGRRRVVALVPAHHLYGMIWTALLPDALGIPVVMRKVGTPLSLQPGDLVVAVPDQWRALLRLTRRFPPDVIGVSSGGALDTTIGTELIVAGLARLMDVYGASETGAIAIRDVPAMAYHLLPRWNLMALADGDWQLVDVRGAVAALPDFIERIGDRSLRLAGRRDGAVQVAGHNVSPERIAAILREVVGVVDAAVRLSADGRLKAFIVTPDHRNPSELLTMLERTASARLPFHERPRHFSFGDVLPRNEMGKLKDWN